MDEVGSMRDQDRYEARSIREEEGSDVRASFLIPHPSSFTLFPNPSTGVFALSFSEALTQASQVVIHDALGRQVWSRKVDAGVEQVTIDLTSGTLEDGVYQLSLRTEEGVVTKTLVLSKG